MSRKERLVGAGVLADRRNIVPGLAQVPGLGLLYELRISNIIALPYIIAAVSSISALALSVVYLPRRSISGEATIRPASGNTAGMPGIRGLEIDGTDSSLATITGRCHTLNIWKSIFLTSSGRAGVCQVRSRGRALFKISDEKGSFAIVVVVLIVVLVVVIGVRRGPVPAGQGGQF